MKAGCNSGAQQQRKGGLCYETSGIPVHGVGSANARRERTSPDTGGGDPRGCTDPVFPRACRGRVLLVLGVQVEQGRRVGKLVLGSSKGGMVVRHQRGWQKAVYPQQPTRGCYKYSVRSRAEDAFVALILLPR